MVNTNEQELLTISHYVSKNTSSLQTLVNRVLDIQCRKLDEYMRHVDDVLKEKNTPTQVLEEILLNLNSLLYWAGNGLEVATLKESVAKMVREEKYNSSYQRAEGTMGDKKAVAALEAQQEELVRLCYTNAVKLYQHKIDRASEMASSIKKVLTHRISEIELSRGVV